MSEQVPTNQVSLDDLKRAIEHATAAWDDKNVTDYGAAAARASAWRTAFEWLNDIHCRKRNTESEQDYCAGMPLIREYLR